MRSRSLKVWKLVMTILARLMSSIMSFRHKLTGREVAVGIVRQKHAESIFDGQTGSDHQEAAREQLAAGVSHRVDGLPRDEHRHHGRFACPCGELDRQPRKLWVGVVVGIGKMLNERLAPAVVRCNLGQPDHRLDGFELTEERPDSR
jgi:hypothetical protein